MKISKLILETLRTGARGFLCGFFLTTGVLAGMKLAEWLGW